MNVVIIELFARLRLASSHKPIFHLKTPDDSPAECASGGGEGAATKRLSVFGVYASHAFVVNAEW